ncbi:acyltransferase family protein [Xylanibacter caecicola]|uniref:acyltransferase family protein n=1 Tax=Xylanibacter caecicola TaxID=2736294 RepID=UPI0025875510|nr:acyltransferase [Xylanibacter caecicola]
MTNIKERKNWIDWMKAIGMLMIVWGHCFPDGGTSEFLYAFNVPLFFIISGYLTRREHSMALCWDKCLHNLVIPYFILSLIKVAGFILKHLDDGMWAWSLFGVTFGFHSINGASGCGNLWFVYALIVIKLVYQMFVHGKKSMLAVSILSLCGAVAYNHFGVEMAWGVTDAMLALPFFMLGNLGSSVLKTPFNSFIAGMCRTSASARWVMAAVLAAATYIIGQYNGEASMFMGQYGESLALFIPGAVAGSLAILILSVLLDKVKLSVVSVISAGSIVILEFHREFLHPVMKLINNLTPPVWQEVLLTFLLSLAATLAFIPIIMILKRYFPIVFGRRAQNIRL